MPGVPWPWSCRRRRSCSSETPPRRPACSPRRPPWPRSSATSTPPSSAAPSSRCWPWTADAGARRPTISRLALTTIDEHRLHDYSLSVPVYAAAARLAVQRGDRKEADLQITRAMRSRPTCSYALPWLAVRVRLQLAKALAANADEGSARHLLGEIDDIVARRPALGALVEEVSELRRALTSGTRTAGSGGTPLTHGGAAPASVPADTSQLPRDRGAVVPVPQHHRHRGGFRSIGSWASRRAVTRWIARPSIGLLGG